MQKLKARSTFIALAALLTLALPAYAQVQPNIQVNEIPPPNAMLGAPTVEITSVTLKLALTSVGVKWSVQKPTLTNITRFDISFVANLEGGETRSGFKSVTDPNARETAFELPGPSNDKPILSRKTVITTHFTTPGVITTSKDFTFGAPTQTPSRPGALDVVSVTATSQGCSTAQHCFEVKWSASTGFPSLQSFQSFNIKLDVSYSNGSTTSGSANAGAAERQKIIAVSPPQGANPQTAKVTINAGVILRGETTATKQTP